jgi:hypothetical protein
MLSNDVLLQNSWGRHILYDEGGCFARKNYKQGEKAGGRLI